MAYDVAGIFEDIELALIESMRNNMKRHIDDEFDEGMNWTQWQAETLAGLSQYRAENKDVLKGYMGKVNDKISAAIREAYTTGESELEIELLKQIQKGYEPPKAGDKVKAQGSFFRVNQRKLNALIKATTSDMKKAEYALLRMNDDIYRKTIFKAQMFYNAGAGGMWKCVDMATKDFLAAGYNCVQYKNGARVNIASYSEMALRTANKRANLMGQANFRAKHGMNLVKVNARGTACPLCMPFLGKVFVDDVYGAGTREDSKESGYPLLSSAVAKGLFHPNCKDACSTYYEGINQPPKELTKEKKAEITRRNKLEQTQRYYEREYRKNVRLSNGSLTEEEQKKYSARASAYKGKLKDLCDANSDVLRYDKQRLSTRGVLSVDKNGRLSVTPKTNKNATSGKLEGKKEVVKPQIQHTEAYKEVMKRFEATTIAKKTVTKLKSKPAESEIIEKLGGGDMTKGSCASLGLAYVGNKNGLNVTDYRGGESQQFFSYKYNLDKIMEILPGESVKREIARSWGTAGKHLLTQAEEGKEYYFCCGRHAAIIRRKDSKLQYLELQSAYDNGWKDFDGNVKYTLAQRFGCKGSQGRDVDAFMVDVDAFNDNEEFKDILEHLNTAEDEQKKGKGGYER